MTAQILSSELANLVQESKRKNTELRNAAEKSLQDLKALPATSESQLAADLNRRPQFISPFLIACGTHNVKFATSAVACLQRLAVTRALPRERLREVLDAFRECSALGLEIQLKILQALPSLLQNYSNELRGELLSSILQVCSSLQNVKNPAVSNTAAATLQQLVISVFDKVAVEDERSLEIPTVAEVPRDDGVVPVRTAAHDAYKVFHDLCIMTEGGKPEFVRFSPISPASGLELIESVLTNHGQVFSNHPEQGHILRSLLMPLIIRSLSERLTFPITLRVIRILHVLIRHHLAVMPSECEIALGLLNHMLDPEASPPWKRALCMEVFRGLYSDPALVLEIYGQYDEKEGKKLILRDNLAAFVRLSTEKPAIIGLGHHSTAPATQGMNKDSPSEQAVVEAGAIAGVIGGPIGGSSNTGISTQWSTLRTPCLDHLDKSEPPNLPETYIYGLALTCINNLSESLAKFILPLTVHVEGKGKKKPKMQDITDQEVPIPTQSEAQDQDGGSQRLSRTQSYRTRTVPINPLSLEHHSSYRGIKTTADLISECWPAVLATCSTFLNAALDADYYRALVRSIQKFTQVAGLLRLSTPRDAFLTTLGKAAVPSNVLTANVSSTKTPSLESPSIFSNAKGLLSVDSLVSQASTLSMDKNRRTSMDMGNPTLSTRNLLCLRALLNLAIALGPTLGSAWSIIFETLQQADMVMAASFTKIGGRDARGAIPAGYRNDGDAASQNIGSETAAVQAAATRLFESTVDFPNDSFVNVLEALCQLLHGKFLQSNTTRTSGGAFRSVVHQRRVGSVSGISINTESNAQDYVFALSKVADLATLNQSRLAHFNATESGWDVLMKELVSICANPMIANSARLLAADIISRTVKDIAGFSMAELVEQRSEIQDRVLSALQLQISTLYSNQSDDEELADEADVEVHQVALEALKSVMEQCGESLTAGWGSVFAVLLSAFGTRNYDPAGEESVKDVGDEESWSLQPAQIISKRLARSAFGSVHLVCSDFLAAVPDNSIPTLLELLMRFCSQQEDLNMSLTTITFFWNVSDFLHNRIDMSSLANVVNITAEDTNICHEIEIAARRGSLPALWLDVLLHLTTVTIDVRLEVRNGAIHTILRIFSNYVDQLSPEAWMLCMRAVLFKMVEANATAQAMVRLSDRKGSVDDIKNWNETTKVLLNAITSLLGAYMDTITNSTDFGSAWRSMLGFFSRYFGCGSHSLGASVFTTITGVLSKMEDGNKIGATALLETADLWSQYFNHRTLWRNEIEENQEAFVAYAQAFKEIYRLTKDTLAPERVLEMIAHLEDCIMESNKVAYSSDVDYPTSLQSQVMECLGVVQSDIPGAPPFLVKLLARFTALPFTAAAANPQRQGPTFVALSKASMTLLQSLTIKHIAQEEIFTSGAFDFALTSLAKPIMQKYTWQLEGRKTKTWQKATSTTLAILKPALLQVRALSVKKEITKAIWDQITNIADGIAKADIESASSSTPFEMDEDFDVKSLTALRDMITPSLGAPGIPDTTRRAYTSNLFQNSLIHQTEPGEIPPAGDGPLEELYKIRYGRTKDPVPNLRSRMSYFCFSELVSLVAVHDSSAERIKLAQAAAPYLILRAALPLKAYIADQPLRGRMPQPESQREELLFVLRKMRRLDCEPKAIPDCAGASSPHKKHLHRLFPLLHKAIKVAGKDPEVLEELVGLMDVVGDEFGI
ncbi:hypothetical protein K432DRAFT_427690 [Lepidopterella palustris CBS 459.81]|uniref:Endosomal peripheral membrane protein n=1 Tax=Lepidopterella palustris CBS 459.81 TaxID=1314670 RepID=A0A8E2JDB7_9PEZI|nr:hypothetical protein K432DRAFT_427690 [Lepidopterella palustris CBS 459.81]